MCSNEKKPNHEKLNEMWDNLSRDDLGIFRPVNWSKVTDEEGEWLHVMWGGEIRSFCRKSGEKEWGEICKMGSRCR